MNIKIIRDEIDEVDEEILKLFDKRMELVLQLSEYKKNVFDKEREDEVEKHYNEYKSLFFGNEFSKRIAREILNESKIAQKKNKKKR